MAPSTLIRISGELLRELNEIRELHHCSFSQAIRYHSKGQLTLGAIIQAKMKDIYLLVEREYPIQNLFHTNIHLKLAELKLAEAYLKKAIATERDRIYEKIEKEELVSTGLLDSEPLKRTQLQQSMDDLAELEANNNELYETKDKYKKKHD